MHSKVANKLKNEECWIEELVQYECEIVKGSATKLICQPLLRQFLR